MAEIDLIRDAIKQAGSIRKAEGLLNISERTIRRRLHEAVRSELEIDEVPSIVDIDELVQERIRKFARLQKATNASVVREIRLKTNKPIGVGFFGDTHMDDDGTNIEKVLRHAELFNGQNEGLYGFFLGDVWNNWVGRLTRLWADQSTNGREAQALVELFFNKVYWLAVLLGNHDVWNGKTDIIEYMLKANTSISAAHEQRVRLVFPNGRSVLIHARHKFPGHSQWTRQFGQIKAAMLGGAADIYVGGDKHVSGYSNGWHDGVKKMWHALQVASYKEIDEYPVELGLSPADLYQCPVAIIDPKADKPLNFIRWEFDPEEGAERLAWSRSKA